LGKEGSNETKLGGREGVKREKESATATGDHVGGRGRETGTFW